MEPHVLLEAHADAAIVPDECTDPRWTLLLEVAGKRKAELVDGEVHVMSPTGRGPSRAALAIGASLRQHEQQAGGEAFGDNATFLVDIPGRQSFSPDAAYTRTVPDPASDLLGPLYGSPTFAVEVRSKHDYGPRMEAKLARKRADYFAAGTQVVWDVDLVAEDVVRAYHRDRPESPTVFRRGETADAEPAVPGWRFPVDELFR
mgnify:CR=1 FL=1